MCKPRTPKPCTSKQKRDSPWASPSPSVTRLTPSASATSKPTCRNRWTKKSCRPWLPPRGANWCQAIRFAKFSPPSAPASMEASLPQPLEKEIVPPVVATAWRELVPGYTVREVFSAKREEVRQRSAEMIRKRLAADGIVVKEVMLRDIELPQEYAKGLESLLLKEQENDRMGVETEIHQKQVKIAEADAEATKVQEVKQAEGQAAVRVLQAKGESDAMQYTLPLKQKQIEQSKLEAEARKEATVKNAEAAGEAKLIDSKAEGERRKLLAQAEAERIRLTASADAERMTSEAAILKQNPLLINKIVAERLSDKLQIMMVPADGKFFFANDVLHSMSAANQASQAEEQPR